jgi:hypothetical protein
MPPQNIQAWVFENATTITSWTKINQNTQHTHYNCNFDPAFITLDITILNGSISINSNPEAFLGLDNRTVELLGPVEAGLFEDDVIGFTVATRDSFQGAAGLWGEILNIGISSRNYINQSSVTPIVNNIVPN